MLNDSDRKGLDALRATLKKALLSGDAESYAACFIPDAFLMHQDTPYVRGTAAIKKHTREVFKVLKVTSLDLIPLVANGAAGVAYEVGVQEVAIEPPMDAFKSKRKHLHVYQRQPDGSWMIAAAMSSND